MGVVNGLVFLRPAYLPAFVYTPVHCSIIEWEVAKTVSCRCCASSRISSNPAILSLLPAAIVRLPAGQTRQNLLTCLQGGQGPEKIEECHDVAVDLLHKQVRKE